MRQQERRLTTFPTTQNENQSRFGLNLMCFTRTNSKQPQVSSLFCRAKRGKKNPTCGHNAPQTNRQVLGLSLRVSDQRVLWVRRYVGTRNTFCGHFKCDLGTLQSALSGSVSFFFFTAWGLCHKLVREALR